MELREKRLQLGLTQPEAAVILNIPFRTYCRYESEAKYNGTFKYNQMVFLLTEYAKTAILSSEKK